MRIIPKQTLEEHRLVDSTTTVGVVVILNCCLGKGRADLFEANFCREIPERSNLVFT